MKCRFNVGRVQCRRLNKGEVVLLGEGSRFLCGHGPQVTQVRLVANEHNDDVGIGVVTKLPKPAFDVLVRQVLRDVVDEKSTDGAAVIPETGKNCDLNDPGSITSKLYGYNGLSRTPKCQPCARSSPR